MTQRFSSVLFPGRHHLITRYQVSYLRSMLEGAVRDRTGRALEPVPDARVVWAVTSANHSGTRRNPVAAHRREAMVEHVTTSEQLPGIVVPVVDTTPTPRFARTVVETVGVLTGDRPDPADTVVACSTPQVAAMYADLGFVVAAVEDDADVAARLGVVRLGFEAARTVPRPWDVLELLVAGDESWRELAHPAAVAFYDRYDLPSAVRRICADPVVSSEGDLTTTRDYRTYARSFEVASGRKWEQVAPHVRPGRVVDLGCATGGLLEQAAATPELHESDLFGVDVSRHLVAEAEHRKAQGAFANPNVFFLQRNILAGPVFPDATVDTTTTIALTHEISSYGDGPADLLRLARRIHAHTAPGGVWVNSDVLGPADGDRRVLLEVDDSDGVNAPPVDLTGWAGEQVAEHVAALSTRARLDQFAVDFPTVSGGRFVPVARQGGVELTLREAMEFLYTKDYVDNWLSECHERFCDLDWASWVRLLTDAGFELDGASRPWRNDWIVENRLEPVARLVDPVTGQALAWPDTHVLTVARRSIDPTR